MLLVVRCTPAADETVHECQTLEDARAFVVSHLATNGQTLNYAASRRPPLCDDEVERWVEGDWEYIICRAPAARPVLRIVED